MHNFADLIDKLGAPAIARAIRGPYADAGFVRQWKERGRIPPSYWPTLIELAATKQVEGVDEAMLLKFAVKAAERRPASKQDAA